MKKAKKMALQAMVCAAFAAAMVLAGCTDEVSNEGDQTGVSVSPDGMKITYDNKGNDSDANFMRVFTQFAKGTKAEYGVKEVTCEIRQTNADSNNGSVFGFMFDLHATKDAAGKDVYDYYVVGIRPCKRDYYIEHYTGVPKSSFSETADKTTIVGTGVETKHWNAEKSSWEDGEGGFIDGTLLMNAPAGGSFSTKVKITKGTEGDAEFYNIYIGSSNSPISCKSVDDKANKGGVAAYSCIYKGKSIAGTMTLDADSLEGSLNLEVAEVE
ncbi:MAG: hypothetical protein K2J50_06665 [Treponemataceae bacterium]|nr:hypothetical protein [Treponemataceae bacterium]